MRRYPPPPCVMCADRHAMHFKVWAPFTRREVAMMSFGALLLGLLIGWWVGFEVQDYYRRRGCAEDLAEAPRAGSGYVPPEVKP
jgi:hypothetical protein